MNRARALTQLSELLCGALPAAPDWKPVLTVANQALITPSLYAAIETLPLPPEVRAFFVEVRDRNRARTVSLLGTLRDAAVALNAAGVQPVPLKGAALMALLGEPAFDRMMCDVDLLVRPAEFSLAVGALKRAGFRVVEDKSRSRRHPVATFVRSGDVGGIDLHQRTPGGDIVGDLHARCRDTALAHARLNVPSAELQVLISVWHDQWHDGHFWRGGFHLRHLMDMALLTRAPGGVDWDEVLALCESGPLRVAARTQALAARRIAGAHVPDKVVKGVCKLAYQRQRLHFIWPALNAPFRGARISHVLWRPLSGWMTRRRARNVATA
jgi:hypothetical protein